METQLETSGENYHPTHHPDALLLELTFSPRGELVVRIPDSISQKGGKVTLNSGHVEEQLRNILNVENKIRHNEAAFYGEPEIRQLAADLKAGRIKSDNIRRSTTVLDLGDLEI